MSTAKLAIVSTAALALLTACAGISNMFQIITTSSGSIAAANRMLGEAEKEQFAGRFREAEKLYLAGLKHAQNSGNYEAVRSYHYHLAELYWQWGIFDKAIAQFQPFLKFQSAEYHGRSWNQAWLANLYLKSGNLPAAVAAYKEALSGFRKYGRIPDTISPLDGLAVCYWRSGDIKAADAAFLEALSAYHNTLANAGITGRRYFFDTIAALTLEHYASMLASTGQIEESRKRELEAGRIWSNLAAGIKAESPGQGSKVGLIEKLAWWYCRWGQPAEADTLYNLACEIQPDTQKTGAAAGAEQRAALVSSINSLKRKCFENGPEQVSRAKETEINPYLNEFYAARTAQDCFDRREQLCHNYAWAVPNEKALTTLSSHQPLVEVGAGTGYWAYLLQKRGARIDAYDIEPIPSEGNKYHAGATGSWANVLSGDETIVRRYPSSTLFLCWPPETNQCAYNALRLFKGNYLIYVGERPGGCTGSRQFHDLVARDWSLMDQVEIPQWTGAYDALFVYARKIPLAPQPSASSRDKLERKRARELLGEKLAKVAALSPTLLDDLSDLIDRGIKVSFVKGECRAYYDMRNRTIYIASTCPDSRKLLAIAHEFAHAMLFPTAAPVPGKVSRKEFVARGVDQEIDVILHELMVARELQLAKVELEKDTSDLLFNYTLKGRDAVKNFVQSATNSLTGESYDTHYSRWYDEVLSPSTGKP